MAQANQNQQQQQQNTQQQNQQQNQNQQQTSWWQRFMANGAPRRTDNVQHDQSPNSPQQRQNNTQQQNTQNQQPAKSPFDGYEGLFDNANVDDSKRPEFNVDGEIIKKTAGNLDFMAGMDPALVDKLKGMGETGEMIMNVAAHMARNAYTHSVDHGTKLTDMYIGKHYDPHAAKGQQRMVQEHTALTGLRGMEAFHHPVVGKMLHPIAQGLVKQYPDAPPEWVQKETLRLFNEANRVMNPDVYKGQGNDSQQDQSKAGGLDFDWASWIAGDNAQQSDKGTPFQQQQQNQSFN